MGHRFFLPSLALLLLIISHAQATAVTKASGGVGSMMRSMVGSRPPSCAGRCWWCGGRRCVAVQVPITPQDKTTSSSHGVIAGRRRPTARGASSSSAASYDDHSNYKPLSWRCKCGGGGAVVGLNP
ncbi:unnamed protein product [Urochloa humidicola]